MSHRIDKVWLVTYYSEDPAGDADELGGVFEDEQTARVTAVGAVVMGHKDWVAVYSVSFNRVLPLESTTPDDLIYFKKTSDDSYEWSKT